MFKVVSKLKPREMIITVVTMSLIGFFYSTKFYKPRKVANLAALKALTDKQNEIKSNESTIAQLKALVGDLNQKKEELPEDVIKPTRFLSELINEINAKENGVKVNSFTTRESPVGEAIVSLDLNLELESTFLDLATLIERLEEKYKFLEFKKIETSKVDDFLQKCKSIVSLSIYLDKGGAG